MSRCLALLLTGALCACSPAYNLTSGAEYAARAPIDPQIKALAATEPRLAFPARIGIARVVGGDLTIPPAEEADLFERLLSRAAGFGDFVPLSPLALQPAGVGQHEIFGIEQARLVAARQHLDYILYYDVSGSAGAGQAAFVDVRNGYLYATVQAPARGPARDGLPLTRLLLPQIEDMLTGLAARAKGTTG